MSAWQNFLAKVRRAVRAFESERTEDSVRWTFEVLLERDELDGGWVAECPAFPGAVAQGETKSEALDAMAAVLADVITLRVDQQLSSARPTGTGGQSFRLALTV